MLSCLEEAIKKSPLTIGRNTGLFFKASLSFLFVIFQNGSYRALLTLKYIKRNPDRVTRLS